VLLVRKLLVLGVGFQLQEPEGVDLPAEGAEGVRGGRLGFRFGLSPASPSRSETGDGRQREDSGE